MTFTSIGNAAQAYAKAAEKINGASNLEETTAGQGGAKFVDFLKESGQSVLEQSRQSEGLSANALQGKANLTDVVTAVSNAEVTLQTVLSIRDKLVQSLQEIMRMPV